MENSTWKIIASTIATSVLSTAVALTITLVALHKMQPKQQPQLSESKITIDELSQIADIMSIKVAEKIQSSRLAALEQQLIEARTRISKLTTAPTPPQQ